MSEAELRRDPGRLVGGAHRRAGAAAPHRRAGDGRVYPIAWLGAEVDAEGSHGRLVVGGFTDNVGEEVWSSCIQFFLRGCPFVCTDLWVHSRAQA